MGKRTRITQFLVTLAAASLLLGAFATQAMAVSNESGDSAANARELSQYLGGSYESSLTGSTGAGRNTDYYFRIALKKGETFAADITPGDGVLNLIALGYVKLTDPVVYQGKTLPSGLVHLQFIAPTSAGYLIELPTSARTDGKSSLTSTFTISPTVHDFTVGQRVSGPKISAKPNHKTYTKISGGLNPARATAVTITLKRYSRGAYRSYKSYKVTSKAAGTWSLSKKLPAGSYSVKATTAAVVGKYYAGISAAVRFKVK